MLPFFIVPLVVDSTSSADKLQYRQAWVKTSLVKMRCAGAQIAPHLLLILSFTKFLLLDVFSFSFSLEFKNDLTNDGRDLLFFAFVLCRYR
jgi:hypothetical protein